MKIILSLILLVLIQASLLSRDITTLSGTTYKDAKVFDSNAAELIISYQDKTDPKLTIMKPIPFTDLPDDIKKEFKYDPAKAEAFEKARKDQIARDAREKTKEKAKTEEKKTKESYGEGKFLEKPAIQYEKKPIGPNQIGGGTAPGEKEGAAEGKAMERQAGKTNYAPGEKELNKEGDAIKQEAETGGKAPGEK
ncbi:MAG TPA: hypothetical protein DCZ94_21295 [Lentisphaeria bacterium]|nr:MAG: hypothetical protein A2X48_01045 [Lentisphaerae bacterium GWF2_49_21]HBC89481.1 hypothetical protein [Lentisphaeria bacterium]